MQIRKIIVDGLRTGGILAATTTAAIMLTGTRENGAPWSAINAIAHIVDGDEKEQPLTFTPRESLLGLGVNGVAMVIWGLLYEGALSAAKTRRSWLTATVGTVLAYLVDYKLVPPRFAPGIEKRLTPRSVAAAYVVLGVTLALSPLWAPGKGED